jgi:carboxyl-terminal processing protease
MPDRPSPRTSRLRVALLVCSCLVVTLLLGGSLALGVGSEQSTHRQVILFAEVLSLILDNYVDQPDADTLLLGAYEGMLGGLDPLGAYLTPAEAAAWKKGGQGKHVGPGVSVLKGAGYLHVVSVAAGSPAATAGIQPGDQIRRIDDASLRDLSLAQARRRLEGEPGSTVKLLLLRPKDGFKRLDVTVARASRKDTPWALNVDTHRGVAILTPADLARMPDKALLAELEAVRAKGVDRLLLDLRDLSDAGVKDGARVAALFGGGEALLLKDKAGKVLDSVGDKAEKASPAWPGSVGVLVNGATAGGAEALAALLRAQKHAAIYGEATQGLGAEPKLIELQDGSALLISASVWETASGVRWNDDGLQPDTVVSVSGAEQDDLEAQLGRTLDLFVKATAPAEARKAA